MSFYEEFFFCPPASLYKVRPPPILLDQVFPTQGRPVCGFVCHGQGRPRSYGGKFTSGEELAA